MPFCPNCNNQVETAATGCQRCGAWFGPGASWETTQQPSDPPHASMNYETGVDPVRGWYPARHWRGELSLPVSYWVNGVAVAIALATVITVVPWNRFVSRSPRLYAASLTLLWIAIAATTVWQLVGTWRSAKSYLEQGHSKLWGNLARVAVGLGLLQAVAEFANVGIPQVSEYAKIAVGHDPIGIYKIRVLRDATEVEVSGAITFGLTQDVRRALDKHPTIRIVHLNSNGGRVGEARNLRDLVESRGLTTYTASECLSACTLVYAAGKVRLIAKNARLGFHQYSFPGAKDRDFQADYETDKQDWLRRGFAQFFVEKAFATPSSAMWRPSHQELLRWDVITGYPESNDVAVTGSSPKELQEGIERELASNPFLLALQQHEPKTYSEIVASLKRGLNQGNSETELAQKIFTLAHSAVHRMLPHASDPALRRWLGVLRDQVYLLTANPALCYWYLYRDEPAPTFDPTKYFPKELLQRQYSAMAEIIRSTSEGYRPPAAGEIRRMQEIIFSDLSKRHGKDVQMLTKPHGERVDETKICGLVYDLYEAILRLSEQESGALLRHMD